MAQLPIPGMENFTKVLQTGRRVSAVGVLGRFLGRTVSEAAAFSAGVAMGPVLTPIVQALKNTINSQYAYVYPDAYRLAEGVSQGQVDEKDARQWASFHGVGDEAFTALVSIANGGPGVAEAFRLWRRDVITEAGFRRALRREGIEAEWINDLVKVKLAVLDPADLARAIHRGLIPDPGLLEGELPAAEGNVPAYPVYPVNAVKEAAAGGYDKDHLGVLVGLQGNPMGTHEAAQAYFRGVLDRNDFLRAVAEGNTRNEWAQAILEQSRQIPTARDFIENALRGYTTLEDAIAGAAKHGMSAEDATVIYQNAGRPMNIHQITTGLARGGVFEPEPGELTDPYMASIVEGSVKPAYYKLALANRYTLPSTFAIRALVQRGDLTEDEGKTLLLQSGWEPTLAGQVAAAWAAPSSGASKEATATDQLTLYDGERIDRAEVLAALAALGYQADEAATKVDVLDARRVVSARGTAITEIRTSYLKHELLDQEAKAALTRVGVAEWAQTAMVNMWEVARDVARAGLSVPEITRAYRRALLTLDAAVAELRTRGYSDDEARVLLGLTVPTLTVKQVLDSFKGGLRTREEAAALLAALGYATQDVALLLGEVTPGSVTDAIRAAVISGATSQAEGVAQLVALGYSEGAAVAFLTPVTPPVPPAPLT